MYRIGEFSKLTQVPVKTLRYYDEIGLLPALRRNRRDDARSYGAEHLERLNRILALKDAGLSLEEIRELTSDRADAADSLDLLERRCEALRCDMARAAAQLERAEARLALLRAHEGRTAHDVAVRSTGPWLVASVRDTLQTHDECSRLIDELDHSIGAQRAGRTRGAVWHACAPGIIDCEAFVIVSSSVDVRGRARLRELPPRRVASLVYRGDRDYLAAYRAVRMWFDANALEAPRAKLELFLAEGDDEGESVTELQFTLGAKRVA
jgi:DNA-binding transcriptional MerR regulator